jgi:hypothetical protein
VFSFWRGLRVVVELNRRAHPCLIVRENSVEVETNAGKESAIVGAKLCDIPVAYTFAILGSSPKLNPTFESKVDRFSTVESNVESSMISSRIRDHELACLDMKRYHKSR